MLVGRLISQKTCHVISKERQFYFFILNFDTLIASWPISYDETFLVIKAFSKIFAVNLLQNGYNPFRDL